MAIEASSIDQGRKKKFFLLLGTLILLLLGAGGVWYTYFEYISQTAVPIITQPNNKFFSIDKEKIIDISSTTSRLDLINTISKTAEEVSPGETVQSISNLSASQFFKILETRAPGSLLRAFDEPFMLGSFGTSTFLILKLVSFENAFAGMLNWEQNLATDIAPLFATRELLRDSTTTPVFIDITDRNKDARLLVTNEQTILLYSFFENNKLIITDNIETLRVLIERLTREKLSR